MSLKNSWQLKYYTRAVPLTAWRSLLPSLTYTMLQNQVSRSASRRPEYLIIYLIIAIFLLDAHYEVFVWFGWWWKEEKGDENSVTATANSHTTGSQISRWLRDKQLALETVQQYAKGAGNAIYCIEQMFGGGKLW